MEENKPDFIELITFDDGATSQRSRSSNARIVAL